jgi:chromosome segregation ATPase
MSLRPRRVMMRPSREFNVVLRARDQQVSSLQDLNDSLQVQVDAYERRLNNARANAHADARGHQLQERKIEQLRAKLRGAREGSASQRRALEDVRRDSEMQKIRLVEAREENLRHLGRIAELEESLQAKLPRVSTDEEEQLEFEGISHDDILDVLAQVTIDLDAVAKMTEEIPLFEQRSIPVPVAARATTVEMGIQTISDEVPEENQSGDSSQQLQDVDERERLLLQAQAASEQDQRRIRELEVDLEHARRLNEELRIAVEEERRLVQILKDSSVQEQSHVASLEDAARQDRQAIKAFEATVDQYRAETDGLEAQALLLRTLLDESRAFYDDLEESYDSIVACKDIFIQGLQERVEELATSGAWSQQREVILQDAQERLAAADIEILELRLELEGAQRNAVMSTNRIIQLEADASAIRHRLRITDEENGDLRDELGVVSERVHASEDELVASQGRLDIAESTIRQLRQELEQHNRTLARLRNDRANQDDTHDVNDTDSVSDEGSMDTLVMDPDDSQLRSPYGAKDVDSPVSANQTDHVSRNLAPLSARALEARLEAMTLKYEAAEAARICGEDVEEMLRAKLQTLSKDTLLSITPAPTKLDPDEHADTPSEEWHSLPTIPEEDEPNTSPTLEHRVAPPRIQTRSITAVKNTVRRSTRGESDCERELATATAESPLLPSPTLSDIWFSDIRVSLALIETGSSVMDWDLPSPGGDSDSS